MKVRWSLVTKSVVTLTYLALIGLLGWHGLEALAMDCFAMPYIGVLQCKSQSPVGYVLSLSLALLSIAFLAYLMVQEWRNPPPDSDEEDPLPLRLFFSSYILTTLLLTLVDGGFLWLGIHGKHWSWSAYLAAVAVSGCIWYFFFTCQTLLPSLALRRLLALGLSLFIALMCISNYHAFQKMGSYISPSMLDVARHSESTFGRFVSSYLQGWMAAMFVGLLLVFFGIWARPQSTRPLHQRFKHAWFAAFLSLLGLQLLGTRALNYQLPFATATFSSFKQMYLDTLPSRAGLHRREHTPVPRLQRQPRHRPHIFLVVLDSWNQQGTPPYDDRGLMPFLRKWTANEDVQAFHRVYCTSTYTHISMPSMFTGVATHHPLKRFLEAPFLWSWLKPQGYWNGFITSHQLGMFNMQNYFDTAGLDLYVGMEKARKPVVNHTGMDDFEALALFKQHVGPHLNNPNKPVFAIVNLLALHAPGQTHSRHLPGPNPGRTPYEKAQYLSDQVLKAFVAYLREKKVYRNSVLLFTGDHSEMQGSSRGLVRGSSAYEEYIRVPLLLRLPPAMRKDTTLPLRQLAAHRHTNLTLLDLLPTLLDLMGLWREAKTTYAGSYVDGASMLRPISSDRVLLSSNSTYRTLDETSVCFALIWKDWRYVLGMRFGEALYNIATDPKQTKNLLAQRPDVMKRFHAHIAQHPFLQRTRAEILTYLRSR